MAQLRRKDTEGVPANGGQYAAASHDSADRVALDKATTTAPAYAWPAIDGAGEDTAVIDYGSYETCVCKNTNAGDGFISTNERGELQDDEATAAGIICLVCGRFYRVDPTVAEPVRVAPAARFDVSAPDFQDAFDAYWDRNNTA